MKKEAEQTAEKKKSGKGKKIAWISVGAAVLALAIFLLIWYFGASFPAFEKMSKKEFSIPGLKDGVCPQGLCALPENEQGYEFAMSGYCGEKASRVYLIGGGEKERYITLTKDGKADNSHFGGVTVSEEYLYVASGREIACVPLESALAAEQGEGVAAEYFDVGLQAAFCQYYEGELYVGEFYRAGNYETPKEHHLEVAGGEINHAFVYAFASAEGAVGEGEEIGCGIDFTSPVKVLSVCDQVQGIAVFEGGIALSCSYGLPASKLRVYKNVLNGEPSNSVQIGDTALPLYILDASNALQTIAAPCMSEEIAVKDGRLYILFESASNKYKFFTRTRLKNVYSIETAELIKQA